MTYQQASALAIQIPPKLNKQSKSSSNLSEICPHLEVDELRVGPLKGLISEG
jgi:hypothetical protein